MKYAARKPYYLFLTGADYKQAAIDWAVDCLQRVDSQNLALLASAEHDSISEVEELFLASLKEIGFQIPKEGEQAHWQENYLCQEIIDNKIDEEIALKQLYQLSLNSGYHKDFDTWLYLDDSIDLVQMSESPLAPFADLNKANIKEIIRREAKRIVSKS